MSTRTVSGEGSVGGAPVGGASVPSRPEGLRERKKRQMRQLLSDTATEMFVERGFDAVRVTEIAEACGVSEKTVFNYFPTKESLLLDRWDATMDALRTGLAEPGVAPVEATLRILAGELGAMTGWLDTQQDPSAAIAKMWRFGNLIQTTPSLRAHQRDMTDQVVSVAAEVLADRTALAPDDPEIQIAAHALVGLWQIQFRSLRTYTDATSAPAHTPPRTPQQIREAVTADVRRAARVLEDGLASFGVAANAVMTANAVINPHPEIPGAVKHQ